MKKLLTLLLAALMLLALVACDRTPTTPPSNSDQTDNNNSTNNSNSTSNGGNNGSTDNNGMTPSGDIKVDDIVFSSVYADGVAIVNLKDEENKAYVIDKSGNIVFDFALKEGTSASNVAYLKFENGLLLYDGKCYDTKGNVTTPESLGATSLVSLEMGKYIVAEKITSTYDSTKKELGILNTDFEWILPLKESNYTLYHGNQNEFWRNVFEKEQTTPSPNDFNFQTITNHYDHTDFVNGKAAVFLWNTETQEFYISLIDTNGKFLFEPIKTPITGILTSNSGKIFFDGTHIVISDKRNGGSSYRNPTVKIYTYDLNGQKIAEMTASNMISASIFSFDFSDGVIRFVLSNGQYSEYYRQSSVKYYTYDFKTLFE